jgi:glycosyltransferase involved in cell wall biosynthesis
MWPRITEKCPDATLHIHSDVDGKWVNGVYPDGIKEIKRLLGEYTSNIQLKNTIYYHGWTSKKELAESWLVSDIWFYPCIFQETFCLTALEAALTKTFAITSDLAALQDTVGERGVRIGGDPMSKEWQDLAVSLLTRFMSENDTGPKNSLIEKNYEWAKNLEWSNVCKIWIKYFKETF